MAAAIGMPRSGWVLIITWLLLICLSDCKLCPTTFPSNGSVAVLSIQGNSTMAVDYLECPNSGYPESHTECCGALSQPQPKCCLPERQFYEIENRVAMAIAITVIACCITVAVLVIVCCFWSRCPLYNTCRTRYTESDVVTYGPADDASNMMMPLEPENKSKHIYAPTNQSINGAAV